MPGTDVRATPAPTVIGGIPHARRTAHRSGRITVALLQDRAAVLRRTAAGLREHPGLDVVLTAAGWVELVHSPAFPADLVVLDVQPREPVSIAARVRTCRAAGAEVVVLTALDDPAVRTEALRAGAAAWLPRSTPVDEVAQVLLGLGDRGDRAGRPAQVRRPRLSAGEELALRMYAEGRSVKEVAVAMTVQVETVRTFLRRVRDKYARVDRPASRRAELVARATEDGYLG